MSFVPSPLNSRPPIHAVHAKKKSRHPTLSLQVEKTNLQVLSGQSLLRYPAGAQPDDQGQAQLSRSHLICIHTDPSSKKKKKKNRQLPLKSRADFEKNIRSKVGGPTAASAGVHLVDFG